MVTIEIATEVKDEIVDALQRLIPQLTNSVEIIEKEDVESIIESEGTFLLLAKDSNNYIVGTMTLVTFTIPTSKKAFIEDVVVDSKSQGLGIGRLLLEAGIALAKEKGVKRIELSSNPARIAANQLYQKLGFEIRKTNFYRLQL